MKENEWEYVIKATSKALEDEYDFHPNVLHPGIGEIMLDKRVYFVPEGLFMMYHKRKSKEKKYCNCAYPNFSPAGVCKKCGKEKVE